MIQETSYVSNYIQQNNIQIHHQKIEEFYEKSQQPFNRSLIQSFEPHIKLSIQDDQPLNFLIGKNGLLGSLKNTNSQDILLGKQIQSNQIYPVDIQFPAGDQLVSNINSRIIIRQGFLKMTKQIQFLLNKIAEKFRIPLVIQKILFSLIQTYKVFYIQDLGSITSTYIKLRHGKLNLIQFDDLYQIGQDLYFHVVEIQQSTSEAESVNLMFLINFNFRYLSQKTEQWMIIIKALATMKIILHLIKKDLYQNQFFFVNRKPVNCLGKIVDSEFSIGRNIDSDITFEFNYVSRRQCRIIYLVNKMQWFIQDGDKNKDSANGTWKSIQKMKQFVSQEFSQRQQIRDWEKIKINDYIMSIELMNFEDDIKEDKPKVDRWINTLRLIKG